VHLFYDGWCPFCRRSIATLQQLDLPALLDPVSFREPSVLRRFGLDAARAEARLQARAASATTTVEGIDAVTLIATRLPALWPTVPLLWAASRLGIGQRVYDWIAIRRKIIPTGCGLHCVERSPSEHDL
jgi:predicted DCC family thiol-disulfide oxidoreductase YuxK